VVFIAFSLRVGCRVTVWVEWEYKKIHGCSSPM
jgi:hypothetical protein